MGGWKLEVFKMAGYVSLPIVCFYLFNKPEYFKEYLAQTKQYYALKEDERGLLLLNEFKKNKEKENEKLILAELESLRAKKK